MTKTFQLRAACLFVAVVYTTVILYACGLVRTVQHVYSSGIIMNLQAKALTLGQLGISRDAGNLASDLAWSNNGVQQVWGLGVPVWIVLNALVCGMSDPLFFPGRIAFAIALLIASWTIIYWVSHQALHVAGRKPESIICFCCRTIPCLAILLFFPSLITLLTSVFRVYEEIVAYGFLFGLFLAVLLMRAKLCPTVRNLVLLGFFCGIAGNIRPTVAIYGAVATGIAFLDCLGKRLPWPRLATLTIAYTTGLLTLLATNDCRFGSPLEFGHSINVNEGISLLYSKTFTSAFGHESLFPAVKEVAGAMLFDGEPNRGDWLATNAFTWQSATPRWRENYFSPIGCLLPLWGCVGGWAIVRSRHGPGLACKKTLVYYAWGSCLLLFLFYARTPVLSSRYMADFGAATAVLAAVSWWHYSDWMASKTSNRKFVFVFGLSGAFIIGYIGWRGQMARCVYGNPEYADHNRFATLISSFNAVTNYDVAGTVTDSYSFESKQFSSRIPYDGVGWSRENGAVAPASIHFFKDIECIKLAISRDLSSIAPAAKPEQIRLKVGLEELKLKSVKGDGQFFEVCFSGPQSPIYKNGLQTVFIAWTPETQLLRQTSGWVLHQIACKDH